jgi:hypothetical protein
VDSESWTLRPRTEMIINKGKKNVWNQHVCLPGTARFSACGILVSPVSHRYLSQFKVLYWACSSKFHSCWGRWAGWLGLWFSVAPEPHRGPSQCSFLLVAQAAPDCGSTHPILVLRFWMNGAAMTYVPVMGIATYAVGT